MARTLSAPPYSAGTVAVAQIAGVWTVTGTTTKWANPDNLATGVWTIAEGDEFVCGNARGVIAEVVSNTSIKLKTWTGAAVAAGSAYTIYRYSGLPTQAVAGLVQRLLEYGSAGFPWGAFVAQAGARLIRLNTDASGNPVWETRLASGVDADYEPYVFQPLDATLSALAGTTVAANKLIYGTGPDAFATTDLSAYMRARLASADATTFNRASGGPRNMLRNPQLQINQRGVSGTVTLAPGEFGHDGFKAGDGGAVYTFAGSTITFSGRLIMPVEAGFGLGDQYALSHEGTALARLWNGTGTGGSGVFAAATRAAPVVATITGAQMNAEFSGTDVTLIRPQLEMGSAFGGFIERDRYVEEMYCRRYFQRLNIRGLSGMTRSASLITLCLSNLGMRTNPTASLVSTSSVANAFLVGNAASAATSGTLAIFSNGLTSSGGHLTIDGFSGLAVGVPVIGNANAGFIYLSAEI